MPKRSRGSNQPGLIDTSPKPKSPPKKANAGAVSSKQSHIGKTFKTTKAATGSRSGVARKPPLNAGQNISKETADKQKQPKTICSVDFGTTYSGVAVVGSVNCGISDIEVLQNWIDGGHRNDYFEKVPSTIAYPEENPGLAKITFGYEVTAAMKSYTWMKLLLVDKAGFTDPHLGGKAGHGMLELPPGKTAPEVVTDYLVCLYNHIMDYLAEGTPATMLATRPIEFWITTPACWDDEANKLSQECAMKAGFGTRAKDRLCMITEPEAALLANLATSIDQHEEIYKPGMNVCVCDIGGGTIDTQSLTILNLSPLKTKEPCVGTGARIGMTDINFKLHDHCKAVFGNSFKDLPTGVVGPSSDFAKEFEVIKKSFDGNDLKKIYRLRLLPLKRELEAADSKPANYDFLEGKITLSGLEIHEMFECLVERALEQVDDQIAQLKKASLDPISVIVLAGGGGTSKYVIRRFQEHCQIRLGGTVMVRRDARAWSAISRGAAIRGLESGMVVSRESKRAYGLGCHKAFDGSIDEEEKSFDCPIFRKRGLNRIEWIIHKGDTIVPGMKVTSRFYISPNHMENLLQYWDFFECEDEEPPEQLDDDDGVEQIGRIRVDLSNNELARKRRRMSHTRGKKEPIRITLEVTVGSEIGVLEVHAFHGLTEVGRANIEYAREKGRVIRRAAARS